MQGTQKYYHWHQGTDIFAPMGTPIRACSAGSSAWSASAPLGGLRLWLEGVDGTQYYYAHLSAYAPNITAGTVVEGGQIIGYVGTPQNAKGTPAHLHFEVHPDASGPVNPYRSSRRSRTPTPRSSSRRRSRASRRCPPRRCCRPPRPRCRPVSRRRLATAVVGSAAHAARADARAGGHGADGGPGVRGHAHHDRGPLTVARRLPAVSERLRRPNCDGPPAGDH